MSTILCPEHHVLLSVECPICKKKEQYCYDLMKGGRPRETCRFHANLLRLLSQKFARDRYRAKIGQLVGVGKGGNQRRDNNHQWIDGRGVYRDIVEETIGKRATNICFSCRSQKDVRVHHIDEDRRNNDPFNLVPLCRTCHDKQHVFPRDKDGKYLPSKHKGSLR